MGAFLGYGEIGVWASNRERDAFLDWFAEHRCVKGDARWEFCKSEENRWTGCCIDLEELIPRGTPLNLTEEEYLQAAQDHWPHVAQLLGVLDTLTNGEWRIHISSKAAVSWRRPKLEE